MSATPTEVDDFADNLVAWRHRDPMNGQVSLGDMQVRLAHAARRDRTTSSSRLAAVGVVHTPVDFS